MSREFRGEAVYAVWYVEREDVLHTTGKADPRFIEYECRGPIVRCRDCRFAHEAPRVEGYHLECRLRPLCRHYTADGDYCSRGERRES